MGRIEVIGIELYANHGCGEEERKLGGKYLVDISVEADLLPAAQADDLKKTVDYVKIHEIVKKEMAKSSKLIETAARRIADTLSTLPGVNGGSVTVKKLNAPIGGIVKYVSVTLNF